MSKVNDVRANLKRLGELDALRQTVLVELRDTLKLPASADDDTVMNQASRFLSEYNQAKRVVDQAES